MPKLNHTGPEEQGPKSGRKLGLCHKTDSDVDGQYGVGLKMRRYSGGGIGEGKRLKYNNIK